MKGVEGDPCIVFHHEIPRSTMLFLVKCLQLMVNCWLGESGGLDSVLGSLYEREWLFKGTRFESQTTGAPNQQLITSWLLCTMVNHHVFSPPLGNWGVATFCWGTFSACTKSEISSFAVGVTYGRWFSEVETLKHLKKSGEKSFPTTFPWSKNI